MRRAERFAGIVIAGSFVLSCACASKHPAAWTPKPRVQWDRVVPYPVPSDYNNYRILLSEPTRGLFPSSIAVTRVAVEAPAEVGFEPRVRLIRDPRNEFLMWNSTFDTHMAISEVFSIDERDLGGSEADPQQIISANKALGARIALVYAVNEITSTSCEMIGALFDTAIAEPIATFHVFAEAPLMGEEDDEADLLDTHATALARSNFEGVVRACVHELIKRDLPADVEPPRGWTPAGSMAPAVWPPRQFRTGR